MPICNRGIMGKFKDELGGHLIREFVGVRAKTYSILTESNNIKKAKGVKKNIVKKYLTHEDYKKCVMESLSKDIQQSTLRSKKHEIFGQKQKKRALESSDTKRFQIDGISTFAWGHCKINVEL